MAMVNVVTIAASRWIYWLRLIGLVQRSAATWRCVQHSSNGPGELSQWQCTATMTAPDTTFNRRQVWSVYRLAYSCKWYVMEKFQSMFLVVLLATFCVTHAAVYRVTPTMEFRGKPHTL